MEKWPRLIKNTVCVKCSVWQDFCFAGHCPCDSRACNDKQLLLKLYSFNLTHQLLTLCTLLSNSTEHGILCVHSVLFLPRTHSQLSGQVLLDTDVLQMLLKPICCIYSSESFVNKAHTWLNTQLFDLKYDWFIIDILAP